MIPEDWKFSWKLRFFLPVFISTHDLLNLLTVNKLVIYINSASGLKVKPMHCNDKILTITTLILIGWFIQPNWQGIDMANRLITASIAHSFFCRNMGTFLNKTLHNWIVGYTNLFCSILSCFLFLCFLYHISSIFCQNLKLLSEKHMIKN